jgi:hypothetical protein
LTASPTATSTPKTPRSPTKTALITATAIVALVAVFALSFKKGYITIEVIDEPPQKPEENSDYTVQFLNLY